MEFTPFRSHADTEKRLCRLPHWFQNYVAYFVTFRLADALPAGLLKALVAEQEAWLRHHPQPWIADVEREYHTRFSVRTDRWLDENHGECLLRSKDARAIVEGALMHFDPERCRQVCWVIMPNHVHLVVIPHLGWSLTQLMTSWKSWTARRLNELRGKTGAVWQRDYFDRIIRDEEHFCNVVSYIRRNPQKAGLRVTEFSHWECQALAAEG